MSTYQCYRASWRTIIYCVICVTLTFARVASSEETNVIVATTWPFVKATDSAWDVLNGHAYVDQQRMWGTAMTAVVAGCSTAEADRTIQSVGYGNSPDEEGNTTLDAMVMDGKTMEAGAVAGMPDIREAAQVALSVLRSTEHTLLVGRSAARFAQSRGFRRRSLNTPESQKLWRKWIGAKCQPNFRKTATWTPDPRKTCGPYAPRLEMKYPISVANNRPKGTVDENLHDTIGLIAIDRYGNLAVGLSTSGATYKVPGRVGDSPIPGAGGYADNQVGGAVGTGDGDVMMRFLLSYQTVQFMREGLQPEIACWKSLGMVRQKGPWSGGLVAVSKDGRFGAACMGFENFQFTVRSDKVGNSSQVITVKCALN